jgi:hypothetical protein
MGKKKRNIAGPPPAFERLFDPRLKAWIPEISISIVASGVG